MWYYSSKERAYGYVWEFIMNFNSFVKKALSAFCVLALVSGCSSTNVDAHGEVKKQAYTLKYINGDDSLKIKGKYTGKVLNEKPDGKGTFIANKGKNYFYYKGNWKNGKLNKKGNLIFKNQKVSIITEESENKVRIGKYQGQTNNGKLSGNGIFETENDSGTKWSYEGEFKDSTFNGYGICKWENGDSYEGNHTNGEFTPTVSQLFASIGTYFNNFNISEKAKSFMDTYPDIFTNRTYDGSLLDTNFSYLEQKKNYSNYGDKLISLSNLQVVQITEEKMFNYPTVTETILDNLSNSDETYYVYIIGSLDGILDNDEVSLIGLPISHFQYENTEGDMIDASVIAGVNIVK